MLDSEIIEIDKSHLKSAKMLASTLSTSQIRKRGLIDMLGIKCAISYLQFNNFRINTKKSVFKIPILFEEFKISDIYYGNYRIDVITLYKEKSIKIPKIHADVDIMPNFYFIVQIGSKIKEAKMVGFIDAKTVLGCRADSKYYYPPLDFIFGIEHFASLTKRPIVSKNTLGKHIDCLGLFLKFIDNDLSSIYKKQLIQHLMNCESCRARFIDALEFEKIANSIRKYPSIVGNYTNVPTGLNSSQINGNQNNVYSNNYPEPISNNYENEEDEYAGTFNNLLKESTNQPIQDKNDTLQINKKFIETIFNEIPKIELPQIGTLLSTKSKHVILVLALMLFLIGSFALIAIKGNSMVDKKNNSIANYDEQNYPEFFEDEEYYPQAAHQPRLITRQKDISEFSINHPVITKPTYSPGVAKVSFEAPESMVKNPNYTKFLQLVGKNVKLNLRNDLLLVDDVPTSKLVRVDIKIGQNIDLDSIKIVESSGSRAIDASVKKVVGDTLKYMKPPSQGLISKTSVVTLSIELN